MDAIGIAFARRRKYLFGFPGGPPIFLSRLTYTNLQRDSGEAFGRLEHLSGFFIKGFAGRRRHHRREICRTKIFRQ